MMIEMCAKVASTQTRERSFERLLEAPDGSVAAKFKNVDFLLYPGVLLG